MRKLFTRAAGLAMPALRLFEPETAHRLSLEALKAMPVSCAPSDDPRLGLDVFGLHFSNPIGVAAGFDKNAEVPLPLLRLGFGHVEIGGVTPRPQEGNPRPRVFRLEEDQALINRLGFNNEGVEAVTRRLSMLKRREGIVGANLGANKDSADRTEDYVVLLRRLAPLTDYFTVNVSSPNTPGLRDLQAEAALDDLMARVMAARDETTPHRPVLLKIAPDISETELDGIVAVVRRRRVDGLVLTNTTTARAGLSQKRLARETGGLSGRPLFERATRLLAKAYIRLGDEVPLIGCGGIDSGQAAWTKLQAGATLVQLYTGLVYHGLPLLDDIKQAFIEGMDSHGYASLHAARGSNAQVWANQTLD